MLVNQFNSGFDQHCDSFFKLSSQYYPDPLPELALLEKCANWGCGLDYVPQQG
jgi:hypothetical protein